MNLKEVYKRKSHFATRIVGSELILVPVKKNIADMDELFTLNEVGSFIWTNINGQNSIEDIVSKIAEEFEVEESTAKTDLEEFLKKLETLMNKG